MGVHKEQEKEEGSRAPGLPGPRPHLPHPPLPSFPILSPASSPSSSSCLLLPLPLPLASCLLSLLFPPPPAATSSSSSCLLLLLPFLFLPHNVPHPPRLLFPLPAPPPAPPPPVSLTRPRPPPLARRIPRVIFHGDDWAEVARRQTERTLDFVEVFAGSGGLTSEVAYRRPRAEASWPAPRRHSPRRYVWSRGPLGERERAGMTEPNEEEGVPTRRSLLRGPGTR